MPRASTAVTQHPIERFRSNEDAAYLSGRQCKRIREGQDSGATCLASRRDSGLHVPFGLWRIGGRFNRDTKSALPT